MDKHCSVISVLILEYPPHRHCRGVILFLLRIGTVHAGNDVTKGREFLPIIGHNRLGRKPPLALDETTAARFWGLLVLTGKSVRAYLFLNALNNFFRESIRPSQFSIAVLWIWPPARINPSNISRV